MNNSLLKKIGIVFGLLVVLMVLAALWDMVRVEDKIAESQVVQEEESTPSPEELNLTQKFEIILGTSQNRYVVSYADPRGDTIILPQQSGRSYFDYSSKVVSNPQVFTINTVDGIENINSFEFNEDKTKFYLSVNLLEENKFLLNRLYEVDVKTLESRPIWVNTIFAPYLSNKYGGGGVVDINSATASHIVLSMGDCYGCDGHTYTKALIINLDTRKELYLENAGDLKIDKGVITYRKFSQVEASCEMGLGNEFCHEGKTLVMRTGGATFSAPLP